MAISEAYADQASGLRRMAEPKPVRTIAVVSGKGGVGKSNVSVNLSIALAQRGKEVMLLDADLGLANVDVLLGLQPNMDISHVLSGECSLNEVIVPGPSDIKIIPAASGLQHMSQLGVAEHAGMIRAFSEVGLDLDVLVVDTAAGISDSVVRFAMASQEVLVVVCDEPASITDAYALIKLLNRDYGQQHFQIVANMVRSARQGQELYRKLLRASDRFLDVSLELLGAVPYDDYLRKAVQRQSAVVEAFPRSRSATAFKNLANKTDKGPVRDRARGHLEFFVERMIRSERHEAETES